MVYEYEPLIRNQTCYLEPAPKDCKMVGCKWVFKIWRNSDGSISRYEARIAATGYNQIVGFKFTGTFSLVVKPIRIRTVLMIALTIKRIDDLTTWCQQCFFLMAFFKKTCTWSSLWVLKSMMVTIQDKVFQKKQKETKTRLFSGWNMRNERDLNQNVINIFNLLYLSRHKLIQMS